MRQAGASMMNNKNLAFAQSVGSPSTSSTKLPFSIVTTLDGIEEEIRALQAEVSTTKKETYILQSE